MGGKWRDALDLVAVTIVNVAAGILAGATAQQVGPAALLMAPLIGISAVFGLLRLRSQSWPTIGLAGLPHIRDLWFGLAIGVAFLALTFAAEQLGLERNLEAVREQVAGGPTSLMIALAYAILGAALYEEITFRGFFMQRLASLFGGSNSAWIGANLGQAVVFGLVHAHQGLAGMTYTGGLSFLLGLIFLYLGRNLWPLIAGHAVYDCGRFLEFYMAN